MDSDQPNCCETSALLTAINRAQEHFIREDDPRLLFEELLKDFLALTNSAYGFIGEILHTAEGVPHLKTHAISNIAWNDETRAFYEKHAPEGLEFFNLKTLFGVVIETGEPLIANAPTKDPRSAGTPAGHPRLDAFLGVPVHSGDALVGMIGVANRPGGYNESQVEFLQPLLKTYGQIIYSCRIRKQREEAVEGLRKSRDELEDRIRERTKELEKTQADLLARIAEHRRAEEKLREGNEILQRIFSTTHFSMAYLDRAFNFIRVNKAYADACGYPEEFFPGKNHFNLYPHGENEAIFRRVVETGEPFTIYAKPFEFPDHPEWGVTYWDWSLYPVRAADKTVEGLVFVLLDVTERKRAEQALSASESRFRTLVEQSPFVIQIYSPDGVIQTVNRAFEQLWGMNLEMLAGYNILKDPQLVEKGVMPYIEMGFSGKPSEVPAVVYDPAQNAVHKGPASDRWIRSFIYPVLDDAGNTREVILFQEDVTEQRKAEEQLRQAAAVFEHTAEAVVVTDSEANICAVNRAFSDITGYASDEVLGKNPRLLKSERHEREFYEAMWDNLQKTGYWRGEIWNRRKNGEIFPVWSTISAIRNEAGRLTHYVSIFSDITSLKRSEEQLYYLAHHDPLTNLPNRLLFNERLGHAMVRARREEHRLAVMFIDLDRFKNINDSLGHPVGDQLLQEVARRLMGELREEDTVARLGGDEFIVLVEEISDAGNVAPLAQKLLEALRRPLTIEDRNLNFTASLGISIFPEDGGDVVTLVKNADAAMYRAKEEGRNEFQFYTRELTSAAFERVLLESNLRRALEQKELVPYFQPLFSFETGKVTGVEVLLRWQHQTMGLILPSRFIPLAEETGLIIPIGEWVIHAACTQMRAWREAGINLDFIAVNISQVRFQRGDFVETLSHILEETGLDPRYLELEITESVVMHKPERAVDMLGRLKELGVSLSLDDFGTGYSSLSYLKTLPVNKLKIDQSFVRGLPWGPNDKKIVMAIITLGWIMGMKVTAEGVETEEQREFLKAQGCREYQGFLSGRPMPAEEFEKFMMRQ